MILVEILYIFFMNLKGVSVINCLEGFVFKLRIFLVFL